MDVYSDTYRARLHSFHEEGLLSPLVKSAELLSEEERDALPDAAFADRYGRAYPVHTPEDTLLSATYFFKTASYEERPDILQHLHHAVQAHGVEREYRDLLGRIASLEKRASERTLDQFGLLCKVGETTVGRYRVQNVENLIKAAEHFTRNHPQYPIIWRVRVSEHLMEKAAELECEQQMPLAVRAYARENVCYSEKTAYELVKRAFLLRNDVDAAQVCQRLAKLVVGSMRTPEMLEKVSHTIDMLDRVYGLDKHYDGDLSDPYKAVYNMDKESAEEIVSSIVDILGDQYTLAELQGVDPGIYKRALGEDFVEAVSDGTMKISSEKIRDILPTLPHDEKVMLAKYLKDSISK